MKIMTCNIGSTDRIARISVGSALIGLGIFVAGTAGIIMSIVGLVPLITGLVGNCPAYSIFKINTCRTKNINPV